MVSSRVVPSRAGVADADRRRTGARFRQHLLRPRLRPRIRIICAPRARRALGGARQMLAPGRRAMAGAKRSAPTPALGDAPARARRSRLREDVYQLGAAIAAGRAAPPERIESLRQDPRRVRSPAGRLTPIDEQLRLDLDAARGAGRGGARADLAVGADAAATGRPHARQAMPGREMRLAVLRRHQEQEPPLVRDGGLRQSRQAEALRRAHAR